MLLLISELPILKFHILTNYILLRLPDQDRFEPEQIITNFLFLKSHSAFTRILHYTFLFLFFFFKKNVHKATQIRMIIQEQASKL